MPLKIYKTDFSPPVRAVLMMAEILNLDYEPQEVNLMAGEHKKPQYLEKNPQGTVPLLEDDDFVLTDSHPIMTYLISKYGAEKKEKLYPSDLKLRSTIDQRMYFEASTLFYSAKPIVKAILTQGAPGPTPQQSEDVNAGYEVLENYLQKTKFVACDHLTVADVSSVAIVSTTNILVPVDAKYKKLNAWWNGLKAEEWYKTANLPGLTKFDGFLKSSMKKNSESA